MALIFILNLTLILVLIINFPFAAGVESARATRYAFVRFALQVTVGFRASDATGIISFKTSSENSEGLFAA